MGRKFDRLINKDNFATPIQKYLIDKGFYESTMNPRFFNGVGCNELTFGAPCLRFDLGIKEDYTLRIFINEIDIFYEVENSYRSYETSGRHESSNYITVKDIDILLDEIIEDVI